MVMASSPSVNSIRGVRTAVANELVPVAVIAPEPIVPIVAIFLLPSSTTALLAAAVPAVIPSIISSSASAIDALPIMKEPPDVILPEDVIAPEPIVPNPLTLPLVSKV